jgi:hypothetical protein
MTTKGLTNEEWNEQTAEHAIDASRYESTMLRHIHEDVTENWQEGDKTAEEILAWMVSTKRMIRVEWGGDDVRYYYPGEIAFVPGGDVAAQGEM